MTTIDQLNAEWDQGLTGLNIDLWNRMKAAGVTARWVDPLGGIPSTFTESINGVERSVPMHERFEFQVIHGQDLLVKGMVHRAHPEMHALGLIIQAAQKLQDRGIQVLY